MIQHEYTKLVFPSFNENVGFTVFLIAVHTIKTSIACICNELLPNSIRGRRGLSPLALGQRTPASRHGLPRTR